MDGRQFRQIRKSEKVIQLASTVKDGDYPKIKFYKTYRSLFTMKKHLEKLKKSEATESMENSHKSMRCKPSRETWTNGKEL